MLHKFQSVFFVLALLVSLSFGARPLQRPIIDLSSSDAPTGNNGKVLQVDSATNHYLYGNVPASAIPTTIQLAQINDTNGNPITVFNPTVGSTQRLRIGNNNPVVIDTTGFTALTLASDNGNININPSNGTVEINTTAQANLINIRNAGSLNLQAASATGYKSNNANFFGWTNATTASGALDTALFRNAAGVVEIDNGTAGTFRDLQSRNNLLSGKITNYNGIATAGWGTPAIQAAGRSVAQTGAVASVATFTPAADGSFLINANVLVTTATTHTFTCTCAYTDEGNTARTLTLSFTLVAGGAFTTSIANANGTVPYMGIPQQIRAKGGTAITIATTGTFTTVTYNVEGFITQIA